MNTLTYAKYETHSNHKRPQRTHLQQKCSAKLYYSWSYHPRSLVYYLYRTFVENQHFPSSLLTFSLTGVLSSTQAFTYLAAQIDGGTIPAVRSVFVSSVTFSGKKSPIHWTSRQYTRWLPLVCLSLLIFVYQAASYLRSKVEPYTHISSITSCRNQPNAALKREVPDVFIVTGNEHNSSLAMSPQALVFMSTQLQTHQRLHDITAFLKQPLLLELIDRKWRMSFGNVCKSVGVLGTSPHRLVSFAKFLSKASSRVLASLKTLSVAFQSESSSRPCLANA